MCRLTQAIILPGYQVSKGAPQKIVHARSHSENGTERSSWARVTDGDRIGNPLKEDVVGLNGEESQSTLERHE